jgi:hypothetical protein
MTPRELRLRQRIDTLTDQRDRAQAQVRSAIKTGRLRLPHGCVYCGQGPSSGRPRTCPQHRDLPAHDPHYQMRAPHATPRHDAA